eukprot:scaffold64118_cov17-Tisochrysis_lutea.AAC.1
MKWPSSGRSLRQVVPHQLHSKHSRFVLELRTRAIRNDLLDTELYEELLSEVGLYRMSTWDEADALAPGFPGTDAEPGVDRVASSKGKKRSSKHHHMGAGELRSAKRKLREMQGTRDRERGRKRQDRAEELRSAKRKLRNMEGMHNRERGGSYKQQEVHVNMVEISIDRCLRAPVPPGVQQPLITHFIQSLHSFCVGCLRKRWPASSATEIEFSYQLVRSDPNI